MGNVNALSNKMDELTVLIKTQKCYRESSLLIFTGTWLTSHVPGGNVDLPSFTTVKVDQNSDASGKSKGSGVIVYANWQWCHSGHLTDMRRICQCIMKCLAVSIASYYRSCEFSYIIAFCVYIPSRADAQVACDSIHNTTTALHTKHPQVFIHHCGGFNYPTIKS